MRDDPYEFDGNGGIYEDVGFRDEAGRVRKDLETDPED
jgi:hypothetical protein